MLFLNTPEYSNKYEKMYVKRQRGIQLLLDYCLSHLLYGTEKLVKL